MQSGPKKQEFLSLAKIARRWTCSHSSVLTLVNRGDLPAVDISTNPRGRSRYIVRVDDLEAFEAARTTSPPPPPTKRRRVRVPKNAVIEFFSPAATSKPGPDPNPVPTHDERKRLATRATSGPSSTTTDSSEGHRE